jgi:hypothetical protein
VVQDAQELRSLIAVSPRLAEPPALLLQRKGQGPPHFARPAYFRSSVLLLFT